MKHLKPIFESQIESVMEIVEVVFSEYLDVGNCEVNEKEDFIQMSIYPENYIYNNDIKSIKDVEERISNLQLYTKELSQIKIDLLRLTKYDLVWNADLGEEEFLIKIYKNKVTISDCFNKNSRSINIGICSKVFEDDYSVLVKDVSDIKKHHNGYDRSSKIGIRIRIEDIKDDNPLISDLYNVLDREGRRMFSRVEIDRSGVNSGGEVCINLHFQ